MISKDDIRVKLSSLQGREKQKVVLTDRPELGELNELLSKRFTGSNKITLTIHNSLLGDIPILIGKLTKKTYIEDRDRLTLTIE